jgi:hypothetical protein
MRVKEEMLHDIEIGKVTLDQLKAAKGMSLVADYKANRETVNAARINVLRELSAIVGNSNPDK